MPQPTIMEDSTFGMNTSITYKVFGESSEQAVDAVKSELSRLESRLSRFRHESEVSEINRRAGLNPVIVSSETYEILSFAKKLSDISGGLFDITVAPLVDLWDYKHSSRIPSKKKIRMVLSNINFRELTLCQADQSAGLNRLGQSIDLGGIGKGYASDRCIQLLKQYDVSSAYINIGGNVSTFGNKPDASPWSVGIRHPRSEGSLIGAVKVTGKAVVTSGDYERFFIDRRGKRWHHILNPVTGYPADSGLISVTVVADSAMTADALSTAIFVAGMNKGMDYLTNFPGVEAILVDKGLRVFITKGLTDSFQASEKIMSSLI